MLARERQMKDRRADKAADRAKWVSNCIVQAFFIITCFYVTQSCALHKTTNNQAFFSFNLYRELLGKQEERDMAFMQKLGIDPSKGRITIAPREN